MKKTITFLFSLFLVGGLAYAQDLTTAYSEDFSEGVMPDGWTLYDEDGDGFGFEVVEYEDGPIALISASYSNAVGPLTPDNYAVTPAINVNGLTELQLVYNVGGQDPNWSLETYTVFVSTGNTVADLLNDEITFSMTEYLGDDPDTWGEQQIRIINDLEMFDDAEQVYIAFRHHDSSDQFIINFTEISLRGEGTLGIEDQVIDGFSFFVNGKDLTVKAGDNLELLNVYNILGQTIKTTTPNSSQTTVSLENISSGMYIGEIQVDGIKKSFKFVIQ